ncbi:MAG TPA: IS110 family transposase [Bradyrhizobium sp.]|nr:IS110 family transposase [Bradyrhizobium sp.]
MEYGAIDLHARSSWIRIVTADGAPVLEQRVRTTREGFAAVFAGRSAVRVLVESSTESEWVAQTIEGYGHEVIVASPTYALMYGHRDPQIKTDRRDVRALAEACRLGIYRRAHRVSAGQRQHRRELRVREQLVRTRTQLINLVRAQLRQEGLRLPTGASHTVPRRYATVAVSETLRAALAPVLTLLETIGAQLRACDAQLTLVASADAVVQRLMTAPGVGPITALTYRAVVDDITRFGDARSVAAYLGLVPSEHSSGARQRKGGITKAGPTGLRVLLIQASWAIWRQRTGRGALHTWVEHLAARRGRRIAVVALARRLGRILYAMWRHEQDYRAVPVQR